MPHGQRINQLLRRARRFFPEVHGLRELLTRIAQTTNQPQITEFIKHYRSQLVQLEAAYTEARYGTTEYSADQAHTFLTTTRKCLKLIAQPA